MYAYTDRSTDNYLYRHMNRCTSAEPARSKPSACRTDCPISSPASRRRVEGLGSKVWR